MDNWQWYQWIMAIIFFLHIAVNAGKHGERKDEKYNFPVSIVNVFVWCFLLWKGGYWR